jgi:hypothetical protein
LNRRELTVKTNYEKSGWRILRNGAPDLIALKVNERGDITDMMAVEVKSKTDRLTYEQEVYRKIFEKAGIPFKVEVVE